MCRQDRCADWMMCGCADTCMDAQQSGVKQESAYFLIYISAHPSQPRICSEQLYCDSKKNNSKSLP